MADDIDKLMADLGISDDTPEEPKEAEVEEKTETTDEDPLAGLLVGEKPEPEPAPVKRTRGRPKGSTKKKTEDTKKAEEPKVDDAVNASDITVQSLETSTESNNIAAPEIANSEEIRGGLVITDASPTIPVQLENSVAVAQAAAEAAGVGTDSNDSLSENTPKDIYILADAQILNGHVYRRGQKITFTKGDKFYNSQTDRNGNNWLDHVDDYEYQYAYFGRIIVEPDQWSGIPMGSTEGITHPAVALAISEFAKKERERNGVPFN